MQFKDLKIGDKFYHEPTDWNMIKFSEEVARLTPGQHCSLSYLIASDTDLHFDLDEEVVGPLL